MLADKFQNRLNTLWESPQGQQEYLTSKFLFEELKALWQELEAEKQSRLELDYQTQKALKGLGRAVDYLDRRLEYRNPPQDQLELDRWQPTAAGEPATGKPTTPTCESTASATPSVMSEGRPFEIHIAPATNGWLVAKAYDGYDKRNKICCSTFMEVLEAVSRAMKGAV